MSIITKASAKSYFLTGAFPTQSQFGDTIDTYLGLGEAGSQTVQGAVAFQAGVIVSGNSNFINGVKVSGNQIGNAAYANTGAVITNVGGILIPASASITDSYLSTTSVSAGTYTNPTVTFSATGRATSVSNGSSSTPALVLLSTANASGASSVIFDSTVITNTYNKYVIEFDGVYCSQTNMIFAIQVSTNNGSAYLSTGYSNAGTSQPLNSSTTTGNANTSGYIDISAGGNALTGNAADTGSIGTIKFANPSASHPLRFLYEAFMFNSTNPATLSNGFYAKGIGQNTGTTAINNIKIYDANNGANITGNFHLYGVLGT